ncbi:hypothetical protein C6501_09135 [Candidatus Poribacteria bacterium]|nr:MAG: hypothetical protein C6501_09135 [Candidatus Poribacteria bacterium]
MSFPLSLRLSLSFANISNKWQDFLFVIIHLKIDSFKVKYSRYGVKNHAISALHKKLTLVKKYRKLNNPGKQDLRIPP